MNLTGLLSNTNWVEWEHIFVPNNGTVLRNITKLFLATQGCCLTCLSLDGCIFKENNMPQNPMHLHCHCKKKYKSDVEVQLKAKANCSIDKFNKYIFSENSNGKKDLFESWGFSINDSNYLKSELERQALEQYLSGNYILKNIDINGQRIAIETTLNGVSFYSGWIVEPNGVIRNTTPFGGWL